MRHLELERLDHLIVLDGDLEVILVLDESRPQRGRRDRPVDLEVLRHFASQQAAGAENAGDETRIEMEHAKVAIDPSTVDDDGSNRDRQRMRSDETDAILPAEPGLQVGDSAIPVIVGAW